MTSAVFSDFEIDELGIKIGTNPTDSIVCVGSVEEEMEVRTISKKCRGIVVKKIVKATGSGTLKVTAHLYDELFHAMHGMNCAQLIEGVKAYGTDSKHPSLLLTMHVLDEDGVEKYRAYPNAVVQKGVTRKVENGGEEVTELELEIGVLPDAYGRGMYEALESAITPTVAGKWMKEFTPELVKTVVA